MYSNTATQIPLSIWGGGIFPHNIANLFSSTDDQEVCVKTRYVAELKDLFHMLTNRGPPHTDLHWLHLPAQLYVPSFSDLRKNFAELMPGTNCADEAGNLSSSMAASRMSPLINLGADDFPVKFLLCRTIIVSVEKYRNVSCTSCKKRQLYLKKSCQIKPQYRNPLFSDLDDEIAACAGGGGSGLSKLQQENEYIENAISQKYAEAQELLHPTESSANQGGLSSPSKKSSSSSYRRKKRVLSQNRNRVVLLRSKNNSGV